MTRRLGILLLIALSVFAVSSSQRAIAQSALPGCRAFNIVVEKENPNRILLFEVYDNAEAFAAHQASAHFKKYVATTSNMVKSRKRIEMVPIALNAKGQ
jgi:quinol monooxygenase YgiN